MQMNMWVLVLALVACSVAASSSVELPSALAALRGMPNWLIKNIGSTVVKGLFDPEASSLYLSTKEGAFASLHQTEGNLQWRSLTPQNSSVDLIAALKVPVSGGVATFLATLSNDGKTFRGWLGGSGKLLWDRHLFSGNTDGRFGQALSVVSGHKWGVLAGNTIHMFDGKGVLLWKIDFNLASTLENKESGNSYFAPSQIVVDPEDKSTDTARLAIGCIVTATNLLDPSKKLMCVQPAIVSVDVATGKIVKVAKYPSFKSKVVVTDVRGVVKAKDEPGSGSILVATSADGKAVESIVLSGSSSTFSSISTLFPKEFSDLRITPLLMANVKAEIVPVFKACDKHDDTSCDSVFLEIVSNSKVALKALVKCNEYKGSLFASNQMLFDTQVAGSASCVHYNSETNSLKMTSAQPQDTSLREIVSSCDLSKNNAFIKGIKSMRSVLFTDQLAAQYYIVANDGMSFLVAEDGSIRWRTDQALASIKQTLIVDNTLVRRQERSIKEMLSYEHRMSMQLEKLKGMFSWSLTSTTVGDVINLLSPSEKGTDFYTAQSFGFMKIAVSLTSTLSDEESYMDDLHSLLSHVKVLGIDLFLGKIAWSTQLNAGAIIDELLAQGTDPKSLEFKISSSKIVSNKDKSKMSVYLSFEARSIGGLSAAPSQLSILAKWPIDSGACEFTSSAQGQCHKFQEPEDVQVGSVVVSQLSRLSSLAGTSDDHDYVYIGESIRDGDFKVMTKGDSSSFDGGHYFYRIDMVNKEFNTYRIGNTSCVPSSTEASMKVCEPTKVGSVIFSPNEVILSEGKTYISPSIDGKARADVLGDDSVLLKYINVNSIVVASKIVTGDDENMIVVTVVDGVSAKIIHRVVIEDAVEPVHTAAIENNVIVTYWNERSKRTELLSMSLYEGLIDKHGLGPFAKQQQHHAPFSSFNSNPPIVIQKTFILPMAVSKLHHTITKNSISIINLIIVFQNGQIYSLDRRQINPRRPITAPSKDETAEGLMQYNPYIMLTQLKYLTQDSVAANIRQVVSSPAKLESTSLVFSFGLDCHFSRDMPSNAFDQLAPDFNGLGLVAILIVLFFVVQILRRMAKRKVLVDAWK